MNIELLISTMRKDNIDEVNLLQQNISDVNALIINQCKCDKKEKKNNIRMISTNELGISKSRNKALENASGEICIICDDDVVYENNLLEIIQNSFESDKSADIITFKIKTPEGDDFKKYRLEEFYHNKRTILKTSSIEIAFRLNSIKSKNIKFDESFGLGGQYISGEENIFLMDCLKKGLKIKYVPIVIGTHPKESSGYVLDEKSIYSKGALFYRLFGLKCIYLNLAFILKKFKEVKFNIFKAIFLIYKGTMDYKKRK